MVYTEDYLKEKLTKELEAEVCEVMYYYCHRNFKNFSHQMLKTTH